MFPVDSHTEMDEQLFAVDGPRDHSFVTQGLFQRAPTSSVE
jgi:hypothetical protein